MDFLLPLDVYKSFLYIRLQPYPTKITVPKEIKQLVDRLLLERISLRGIARVTLVCWSWLQDYVNQQLRQTPRQLKVPGKTLGKLTIECDELWSFVESKKNEVYVWLAMDRNSRKIVGCFVGDRTRKSARKLWASLPEVYQQSDERLYRFLASL